MSQLLTADTAVTSQPEPCPWCPWPIADHTEANVRVCIEMAAKYPGLQPCPYCGSPLGENYSCYHFRSGRARR